MKWSYDLAGAEPIIKDEPVYNANIVGVGEYLMVGTSAWTAGADAGYGLVNACVSTVATAIGINGVGISLQQITTAGNGLFYSLNAPQSVATALNGTGTAVAGCGLRNTNSYAFTKVIINPLAVYRTLVSQNTVGTADCITVAAAASNTTIQLVITGAGTPTAFTGQWCYFCGTAGPNFGTLRKIVTNASAATFILDAACTNAITSADKIVIFPEMNLNPNLLSTNTVTTANATNGSSLGTCVTSNPISAGQGELCATFRVVDNYIEGGTYTGGIAQLRYNVQGQYTPAYNGTTPLVNKLSTTQFYQDLISLNHAFNASSTAY